eukprot:Skav218877  [mRNA]  locus=scaffold2503:67311:81795:+ [translate_table: standard]
MLALQTLQMLLVLGSVGMGCAEDLACAIETVEWQEYYSAYEEAARATALEQHEKERASARAALAQQLLLRTNNVTDVLSCNVGVIAGYFLLARLVSQEAVDTLGLFGGAREGKTGLAYRLLQMALVFIFTLRNANRIPPGPAKSWGVTEHHIIPAIMHMRHGQDHKRQNDVRRFVPISPSFRDPDLSIAIVSICAYPPDHPLALPKLTPPNREAYAQHHGYSLRLHLEHPVIGAHGLGVQHAKLATVLAYLQSNKFDWVAWLDCDSIIMNMNKTLDSIIYQHAQKKEGQEIAESQDEVTDLPPVCGEVVDDADALIGEWLDSWVTSDFQEESLIQIHRGDRGADNELYAEAPQIGLANGRLVDNQLEMDFDGGTLRAQILWNSMNSMNSTLRTVAALQWDNGARWLHKDPQGPRAPCREPCRARQLEEVTLTHEDLRLRHAACEQEGRMTQCEELEKEQLQLRQELAKATEAVEAQQKCAQQLAELQTRGRQAQERFERLQQQQHEANAEVERATEERQRIEEELQEETACARAKLEEEVTASQAAVEKAETAERSTRAELDAATSKRAELECQASAAQSEADSARPGSNWLELWDKVLLQGLPAAAQLLEEALAGDVAPTFAQATCRVEDGMCELASPWIPWMPCNLSSSCICSRVDWCRMSSWNWESWWRWTFLCRMVLARDLNRRRRRALQKLRTTSQSRFCQESFWDTLGFG